MRKPEALLYGVNDTPPVRVALFSAIQQVAFLVALLGVPGVAAARLGLSHTAFFDLAAMTLFCSGLVVILQGFGRFGIGSGLFYPLQCTTAAIPALAYAGTHGLDLGESFTMVAVVGVMQILFSFVVIRLRGIFTVEVAGLAVFLIGVGLGQQGLLLIVDIPKNAGPATAHLAVAMLTLGTLIILNVYVRSRLRMFTNLIGLAVGLAASAASGLLDPQDMALFASAPWVSFPTPPVFGWGFDIDGLIPFAITGFVFSLTSIGVQTIAQRNNDRDWKGPDLKSISRGVRAEGLTHLLAAGLNALPMVASGGAVALASASGCTARALTFWTGGLLILISALPKVMGFWFLMPDAVTGALFLFLATFTTVSGLQLVASRLLDGRKIIAIGMGFVTAIAYEPVRALMESRTYELQPVAFSAFAVSILVTVALLTIFRIGAKRNVIRRFAVGRTSREEIADFLESEGRRWGARVDVVNRGSHVTSQAIELIGADYLDADARDIEVETRYDDVTFEVILRYTGASPILSGDMPSADDLIDNPELANAMTGYLISRLAPDIRVRRIGPAAELHFKLPV
ncbi:MAG: hypothetical protein B7Z15_03680 [Rhizobiales bacterium 32-66-8]|nr:MAG: hypothetical protein B7Z15_03680 [Rhizobiales bacterium 32-66-8]